MSDSSQPHGLQPTRLLCPWDFPGKSTGVGRHCLLHSVAHLYINKLLCIYIYRFYHEKVVKILDKFYFTYLFYFIFFYFTILYWFCHTSICICHRCTCVPHPEPPLPTPSPYHPSGSSKCTSPKLPVSCIEPGLAICFIYDIIHVLMPFSQIISPSPSPTESKRLFYTTTAQLQKNK